MSTLIKIGATSYGAVDYTVPAERTFRGAWEANADVGVISVDMAIAKDLWRDKIRKARTEPLETGADTIQIIADKQALRDAPDHSDIDAATTPEELVAVQPAGLTVA